MQTLTNRPETYKSPAGALREVLSIYFRQELSATAASVSYYAIFSSIPLIAILLTLSANLLPDLSAGSNGHLWLSNLSVERMDSALQTILPHQANQLIRNEVERIQRDPPFTLLTFGFIISLWTATSGCQVILKAMDRIYQVNPGRSMLKTRLYALSMALSVSAIFVLALVYVVWWPSIMQWLGLGDWVARLASIVQPVILAMVSLICFEIIYRIGPGTKPKRGIFSYGSKAAAGLFTAGTIAFQLYISHYGTYDKTYGSLAGVMIFLVWLWLTNVCLLIGCTINKVRSENIADSDLPNSIHVALPSTSI